jgi:hypothetical protein
VEGRCFCQEPFSTTLMKQLNFEHFSFYPNILFVQLSKYFFFLSKQYFKNITGQWWPSCVSRQQSTVNPGDPGSNPAVSILHSQKNICLFAWWCVSKRVNAMLVFVCSELYSSRVDRHDSNRNTIPTNILIWVII